jgi:tetratricopeptide (TPR) repeat protein
MFILLASILSCSCQANRGTNGDVKKLRDSIGVLVQKGLLQKDSLILRNALKLSDSLLEIDTTKKARMMCYYNRRLIFVQLGDVDKAIENLEKYMLCLPENNPDRLNYMAVKYLNKQQKDSANFFWNKALAVCNSLLQKQYNSNIVMKKIEVLYLKSGEQEAKKYMLSELKLHSKDQILQYLKSNWTEFCTMEDKSKDMRNSLKEWIKSKSFQ